MIVLAAAAHPDDIEFGMAGTLLRLKARGCRIHLWNLADGSCGTPDRPAREIVATRWREARASAAVAGATAHPPIGRDLALFFEPRLLARTAAVIRTIRPQILLVPSPEDYMEDHQNACRLLVTGAFVRGMRNFVTAPRRPPVGGHVAIYHALPHGLKDGLNRPVRPDAYVDVTPVMGVKRRMLACHRSQRVWLDASQGMGSYLEAMVAMSRTVGQRSGRFRYAEGWRRHNPLGFGPAGWDPLRTVLGARAVR